MPMPGVLYTTVSKLLQFTAKAVCMCSALCTLVEVGQLLVGTMYLCPSVRGPEADPSLSGLTARAGSHPVGLSF